ncbi:MAG: cupin domain-containing protein [Bryobacteraceae bacterium]
MWHKHDTEHELFLVIKGRFRMEFRDSSIDLETGEFLVVPRGVEQRPVADQESRCCCSSQRARRTPGTSITN